MVDNLRIFLFFRSAAWSVLLIGTVAKVTFFITDLDHQKTNSINHLKDPQIISDGCPDINCGYTPPHRGRAERTEAGGSR